MRLFRKIKEFFIKLLLECVEEKDDNSMIINDEDTLFHKEVRKHGKD